MPRELTQERVHALFTHDRERGLLIWNERPATDFRSISAFKTFNKRFAGKVAGYVDEDGYRYIVVDHHLYLAHRLIWLRLHGCMPPEIDHEDGDRSNNREGNLREATTLENAKNQGVDKRNISGVTGVVWNKKCGKWQASIRTGKTLHYLGLFENVADAATVRKQAEEQFGFHQNHGARPSHVAASETMP